MTTDPAADDHATRLASALSEAATRFPGDEANFRHEAEQILEKLAGERGVQLDKRFERILTTGRADAVFNRIVVEWEPPGRLAANEGHSGNKHAVGQVRDYIDGIAAEDRLALDRLAGVACDGHFMIFARYRAERWLVDEPLPVDERSAEQLLDALVAAQSERPLTSYNLLRDFGPRTTLTRQLAQALLDQLDAAIGQYPDGLTARLYRQWETFFAVATGVVGEGQRFNADARRELARIFNRPQRDLDPARALFALQTYFAVVTKLIALLSLSLYVDRVEFRLEELAEASDDDLWEDMHDFQRGDRLRAAGFQNLIEPDVFTWYLEPQWTSRVREGIRQVIDRLADYDPTTLQVSPEDARDLLKDLYQGLLPRAVRHALGQYFTPDWLADQLLHQVEYDGQPEIRLVDPACGTGTFLVLAIRRLKDRLRRDGVPEADALAAVLRNVVGFDIDPLATVAARTNYVLALGALLRATGSEPLDIPVYMADSIVMPVEGETLLTGDKLELPTAAGTFSLPRCIDTPEELRAVCDLASLGVEHGWGTREFVEPAALVCSPSAAERDVLAEFYERCLEQHRDGLDGLWPHVLRNAFMPAFIGEFDLVVGNPPWVNWESLPQAYVERTRPLWTRYGLFVHRGMAAMLGAGKKDVAMLMSYVVTDKLLKDGGRLGFVITQTVFKTAGAGQGFRRFKIGDHGPSVGVEQVDDMVDLNPFVGATNRTALFTWRKGKRTRYPVRYVLWQRATLGQGISPAAPLEAVLEQVRKLDLVAAPVGDSDPTSAWLTAPRELVSALRKLAETGDSTYRAHAGVFSGGTNGVYWVSVDGPPDRKGRLPVSNLNDVGRTTLPKRYGRVEKALVHPLIRGVDVRRWNASPSLHILFVQDPEQRIGIAAEVMRRDYPGALAFLNEFEPQLRARAAFQRYFDADSAPFWSMFDVGSYTLEPHKVLWKDQARDMTAAVAPVAQPIPLPNHKVMLVACGSEEEAHFLCACLNSTATRAFVAAYVVETQVSTHAVKYVHIPRFDSGDENHLALARASVKAHEAVARGEGPDQNAVDSAAASLWGLTSDEALRIGLFLDRLHKRDLDLAPHDDGPEDAEE